MKRKSRRPLAVHVSLVSILWNILLSAFKLFAGIFAHSGAMISDAVHSLSDVLSTLVVIAGVKLAGREADADHPYGHERLECVAALLLSVLLFATGLGIGLSGGIQLFFGQPPFIPGLLALIAALVSIAVKEAMYWYTRSAAKRLNSSALMADAWHHRSDALSSVGSFAGILGARLGFPLLDPLASVVICLFILKASVSIFQDAVGKMTDHACDAGTASAIRALAAEQPGVLGVDQLKTRMFGNRIYVDLEIRADAMESLNKAHDTAQQIHDAVEERFPQVKHCMVHVNPAVQGGRTS